MQPVNSIISETSKIYENTYIKDSRILGESIISDRAVVISSEISDKVEIGRDCSVVHSFFDFGTYLGKGSVVKFSEIGKYCNLSWHLSIGGSNHNYKAACMYTDTWWKKTFGIGDGLSPVIKSDYTVLGNDVWLGSQVNIVRGVKIGDGAVIGANSLVLDDIPPYAIAVGSPARIIKYRFDENTINRLLTIKWWDWNVELIQSAADYLRGDLTEDKLIALEKIYYREVEA